MQVTGWNGDQQNVSKYGEAYAENSYDALCKLAERMELDREEILITFGLTP